MALCFQRKFGTETEGLFPAAGDPNRGFLPPSTRHGGLLVRRRPTTSPRSEPSLRSSVANANVLSSFLFSSFSFQRASAQQKNTECRHCFVFGFELTHAATRLTAAPVLDRKLQIELFTCFPGRRTTSQAGLASTPVACLCVWRVGGSCVCKVAIKHKLHDEE